MAIILLLFITRIYLGESFNLDTQEYLEEVVLLQDNTEQELLNISNLLLEINYSFDAYNQQNPGEKTKIEKRLNAIRYNTRHLVGPDIEQQINDLSDEIENFFIETKANIHDPVTSLHDPHDSLNAPLKRMKSLYGSINKHITNSDDELKVTLTSIFIGIEAALVAYAENRSYSADNLLLIASTIRDGSYKLLKSFEHSHNDKGSDIHDHDNTARLIEETQLFIKKTESLYSVINQYVNKIETMDPTSAQIHDLTEMIYFIKNKVNNAFNKLKDVIANDINESRTIIISNTKFYGNVLLLLDILMLIIFIFLISMLSWTIARSHKRLNFGISKYLEGDLSYRIEPMELLEYNRLATNYNNMADTLSAKDLELQAYIKQLHKLNNEISETNQNLEEQVALRTQKLEVAVKQAKEANRSKSEFLANMSHELRTPMHGILSYSEMGKTKIDRITKDKTLKYFSSIHESAQRLLSLLNNLLDLSKLDAGFTKFNILPADLANILDRAINETSGLLHDKSIHLVVIPPVVDTMAHIDPEKIQQVIINLLSNAIKFTPQDGRIEIEFLASYLPVGKRKEDAATIPALEVRISDTGIGIPEDELDTIFDKFVQSSKTKTGAGGTGLGLAICKELVIAHGGVIRADNNPDGGAIFSFILPKEQNITKINDGNNTDSVLSI
ncbi:MAG: HAMP domain-containing histidine kinase [Gammaproteobacteria bacterium]|nr:HAMP domain-containing histidine kinase [Gammaproteobacteria bacterium]